MSIVTIRNLDPLVKIKLRERAARHGRSMESEMRDILAQAVDEPESDDDFAQAIVDAFADTPVDLELYERKGPAVRANHL